MVQSSSTGLVETKVAAATADVSPPFSSSIVPDAEGDGVVAVPDARVAILLSHWETVVREGDVKVMADDTPFTTAVVFLAYDPLCAEEEFVVLAVPHPERTHTAIKVATHPAEAMNREPTIVCDSY